MSFLSCRRTKAVSPVKSLLPSYTNWFLAIASNLAYTADTSVLSFNFLQWTKYVYSPKGVFLNHFSWHVNKQKLKWNKMFSVQGRHVLQICHNTEKWNGAKLDPSWLDLSVHLCDNTTKQSSVSLHMRMRVDHQDSGVDLKWLSHSYPQIRNHFCIKLQQRGKKLKRRRRQCC